MYFIPDLNALTTCVRGCANLKTCSFSQAAHSKGVVVRDGCFVPTDVANAALQYPRNQAWPQSQSNQRKKNKICECMLSIGHGAHGSPFTLNHSGLRTSEPGIDRLPAVCQQVWARVFHLPFSLTTTHFLCSIHLCHSTRLTRQARGGRRQRSPPPPTNYVLSFSHRRFACGRLRALVISSRKVSLLYDAGCRSPAFSVSRLFGRPYALRHPKAVSDVASR